MQNLQKERQGKAHQKLKREKQEERKMKIQGRNKSKFCLILHKPDHLLQNKKSTKNKSTVGLANNFWAVLPCFWLEGNQKMAGL